MFRILVAILAALVLIVPNVQAAGQELKVFIWSEYIDPEIPKDFEKATGVKVRLDFYESNEEMIAKLQAGGVSQYDIIVPSDYIMPLLLNQNLVRPLDQGNLSNLKNLRDIFRNTTYDPGNKYSVPYQWGTVGLLYNKEKIKDFKNSWGLFFNPKTSIGPFWLMDGVREQMGIALLYLGYNYNSTSPKELKEASDLLIETKKRKECLGFKGGVGGKNDVVAGVAVAAVVYNGDAIQAISKNADLPLAFTIPDEGSEIWYDSMSIPAKAPNPEAAHQWINYILDAKVAAKLANFNQYASPNQAALSFINKEDLWNPGIYPTPEEMKRLHFTKDRGKENRIIDEAWTRVKSN